MYSELCNLYSLRNTMKKIPRAAIDYCHLLIKNVGVANKKFIY